MHKCITIYLSLKFELSKKSFPFATWIITMYKEMSQKKFLQNVSTDKSEHTA